MVQLFCFLLAQIFATNAQYQETCPEHVSNCSESNICTGCWQDCGYCQCTSAPSSCIPEWTTNCSAVTCMTCSNSNYSVLPTWSDGTGLCKPNQPREFTDHITATNGNFYLYPNDRINSIDNTTYLTFQTDGDLVLYAESQLIWHSNTTALAVDGYVRFQWDRNLVVLNKYGETQFGIGIGGIYGHDKSHLVVTYRCVYIIEPDMDRLWYEGDGCNNNTWPSFATPTSEPTSKPTSEPTAVPTNNPSQLPTAAPTLAPSQSPTNIPSVTPSVAPTVSPSSKPSYHPTATPSLAPTVAPSNIPSLNPSAVPSDAPSQPPTYNPSVSPSDTPTTAPSDTPTQPPSNFPSNSPIQSPTSAPSMYPSASPSRSPSQIPTISPSVSPSAVPTVSPSNSPSQSPIESPTYDPTVYPTIQPTQPTQNPTHEPSTQPTMEPTINPTTAPSISPTSSPINTPTQSPSNTPTASPIQQPTLTPTMGPTPQCPSLYVTVTDAIGFTADDFNGLYLFSDDHINDRSVWRVVQQPDDKNVQYDGTKWIINGEGDGILSYITNTLYPPQNDITAEWSHSTISGVFHVDMHCVDTLPPVTAPSNSPIQPPSIAPTASPSVAPTSAPSSIPTSNPTMNPISNPTNNPTSDPTINPTIHPTLHPIHYPTSSPSLIPSDAPIKPVTIDPTFNPTMSPSRYPTLNPTIDPTLKPTFGPTKQPITSPTNNPTYYPSIDPTYNPTSVPSTHEIIVLSTNDKDINDGNGGEKNIKTNLFDQVGTHIGISIGSVLLVVCCCCLLYFCVRKIKMKKEMGSPAPKMARSLTQQRNTQMIQMEHCHDVQYLKITKSPFSGGLKQIGVNEAKVRDDSALFILNANNNDGETAGLTVNDENNDKMEGNGAFTKLVKKLSTSSKGTIIRDESDDDADDFDL